MDDVIAFEADLHDALDSTYAEFTRELVKESKLTDELEDKLKALLEEFKKSRG